MQWRKVLFQAQLSRTPRQRNIPFLQAVIREGLRLYPATGNQKNAVPPEGDYLNGVFIPGGTVIGINLFPMLCTPDNFGPDSEIFNPDRWIDVTPKGRKKWNVLLSCFGLMERADVWGN